MRRIVFSLLSVVMLIFMTLPAISPPPALATETTILFQDDFGSGTNIDNVEDWDLPGYDDWNVDSDNDEKDAAIRAVGGEGFRYLRLRDGAYVEKHDIDTTGLMNIHLEYTWGQDTDCDGSDDGDLVVEWKLSSSGTWTAVNTHDLVDDTKTPPNANSLDLALDASAEGTSIDIRFRGDTDEDEDRARVDNVIVSGDPACTIYYRDNDDDDYGQTGDSQCLSAPSGNYTATEGGDCDDTDPTINPSAAEVCNDGRDNDCDGLTDCDDNGDCPAYYRDNDDDGYGQTGDSQCVYDPSGNYTATEGGDCDDTDPTINPGAPEVCDDTIDNDCDGLTDCDDTGDCPTYYRDDDGDGYGQTGDSQCPGPSGNYTATEGGDCDDTDAAINPGATEVCNGYDDDCDGKIDEEGATGCTTYYKDVDDDTYGVTGDSKCLCAAADPYDATQGGDCDDNDAAINPGATEVCNDGVDNDCDGLTDLADPDCGAGQPPHLRVDKSVSPDPNCGQATVTLTVRGAGDPSEERLPVDVMLIIDRSGSMMGAKMTAAKQAAKDFIDLLDSSQDRVGLVSYSDGAILNAALTTDFAAVKSAIDGLSASGYTNIGDAINIANTEFVPPGNVGRPGAVWVEILLTDGWPNRPNGMTGDFSEDDAAYARDFAEDAADDGIMLYTIGLGNPPGISHYFLDDLPASSHTYQSNDPAGHPYYHDGLAYVGGGDYYHAPTPADLEFMFEEISEDISSIAGKDVVVTEVLPDGVNYADSAVPTEPDQISPDGQTLTWNVGIISINETWSVTFSVVFDEPGYQLVDEYPDTRVDYTNYLGDPAFKVFPRTYITVQDCDDLDYYDDWEFYCDGNEVWKHHLFHDFSCVDGSCAEVDSYYTDDQFVEDCNAQDYYDPWEYYCVGDEVWMHRMFHDFSCVDGSCTEVGSYYTDDQFVEDCDDLDYYDDWEFYCDGNEVWMHRMFHDFSCVDGSCAEVGSYYTDDQFVEDCDDLDYYDDWEFYCDGNEVWKHHLFHDFSCVDGSCTEVDSYYTDDQFVEDCDDLDYYDDWEFYCDGNEVWMHRMFHDFSCVDGSCAEVGSYYTDDQFVEDCDDLDYYDDWEFYCDGNEVWKHHLFHDFSCVDGSCTEVDSYYTDDQFVEDCDDLDYYDDWEFYCDGNEVWMHRMFHDFSCVDGSCAEVGSYYTDDQFVEDCDDLDYYDDWEFYCDGNEVWKHHLFHDFSCVDGSCTEVDSYYTDDQFVEDCDDLDYYDDWEFYCDGNEVWKHHLFHDFSCVDGSCTEVNSYYTDDQFIEDCGADYYTNWVYYCEGDSVWRTRDLHDFYCLNGTCQEDVIPESEWFEDCQTDYYTDWVYYCVGDSVWRTRDLHDFYCLNGTCQEDVIPESEWFEDCQTDYYTDWVYYCVGDSVWRTRDLHDFYCLNGTCQEDVIPESEWFEDCQTDYYTDWVYYCVGDSVWRTRDLHDFYCLNGTCQEDVIPESEWYADCQTDYYTDWVYYCVGDSVWRTRDFHDYYCLDGTCSENITPESEWFADCDDGDPCTIDTCQDGQCVHTPVPGPTAGFSADETNGCAPLTVVFTDSSTGDTTSWSWSFPGGNPSGATGPGPHEVTYDNPGTYTVSLTISNRCGDDTETKIEYITVRDCTPEPPAGGGGAGCPRAKHLTVDWEGNNTTKPLYSNDKLALDLLGPSPDTSDNLFLERGTHAPVVDERTYYLIVVRELEQIPALPDNTVAIVVLNITPTDAEFNRDILLTLGLNQTQLPANTLNVTMAYYDDVNGLWQTLEYEAGGPNGVAELTLSAPINHFSIYGVLAELTPEPTSPAHFVPSGLSIMPSVEKISAFVTKTGDTVTITASVANDGGQEDSYTVVVKLNGQTVDTNTITLAAGQSQQVTFIRSGLDYGQYDVEVAGLSGEFTVSQTLTWWLIILIIIAIGLIIWGVIWGLRRRRKAQQET